MKKIYCLFMLSTILFVSQSFGQQKLLISNNTYKYAFVQIFVANNGSCNNFLYSNIICLNPLGLLEINEGNLNSFVFHNAVGDLVEPLSSLPSTWGSFRIGLKNNFSSTGYFSSASLGIGGCLAFANQPCYFDNGYSYSMSVVSDQCEISIEF